MPSAPRRSRTLASVLAAVGKSGKSARQVAKDADISQVKLVDWMNGREPSAFATLDRLASSLGLEIVVRAKR